MCWRGCWSAAIRRSGTIIPLFGPPAGHVGRRRALCRSDGLRRPRASRPRSSTSASTAISSWLDGRGKTRGRAARGRQADRGRPSRRWRASCLPGSARCCSTQTNHERIGKARGALKQGAGGRLLGKLFRNNYGWSGFGLVAAIVAGRWHRRDVAIDLRQRQRGGDDHRHAHPDRPVMMGGAAMIHSGWRAAIRPAPAYRRWSWWSRCRPSSGSLLMLVQCARHGSICCRRVRHSRWPRRGLGFHWLQAPSRRWPQDHGSRSRAFVSISASPRRIGSTPQPAGEDAGAVRAIPALRGGARRREHLGQAFRRRAGGGRRGSGGGVLVYRRPQLRATIRSSSPITSAATCRRPIASASTPPGSSGGRAAAAAAAAHPAAAVAAAAARAGDGAPRHHEL